MTYQLKIPPTFKNQFKRIHKKFPQEEENIKKYISQLENTGPRGDRMPGYPFLFKDRMPLKAYGIGKSGGLRIVVYHQEDSPLVCPLLIYHKSNMEQPADKMIVNAIKRLESLLQEEE